MYFILQVLTNKSLLISTKYLYLQEYLKDSGRELFDVSAFECVGSICFKESAWNRIR